MQHGAEESGVRVEVALERKILLPGSPVEPLETEDSQREYRGCPRTSLVFGLSTLLSAY